MAQVPRSEIPPVTPPAVDPESQETLEELEPQAPSFASHDKVTSLEAKLEQLQDLLGQNLANRNNQREAPPEAAIEDVTDEDLEATLVEGKSGVAKLIRKAVNAGVERRVRGLEQKIAQIEQAGIESIGAISERVAKGDMPYLEHPKLAKQMKAAIAEATAYNPRIKTNPVLLKVIHDKIVGENFETLQAEKVEEALRKARGTPNGGGSAPTDANGRSTPAAPDVPTPQELLGPRVTLTSREADEYAQAIGYASWAAYATVIQKQQEAQA